MNTPVIRLADNAVTLLERAGRKRVRHVRLGDFLDAADSRRNDATIPLLPEGTRWYGREGDTEITVVEHPPRVRTIETVAPETHHLAFPYVVYLFRAERGNFSQYGSRMFFRTSPLASLDDPLAWPVLGHVQSPRFAGTQFPAAAFCLGKEAVGKVSIPRALESFWGSRFRSLLECKPNWCGAAVELAERDPRFKDYAPWAEATAHDPDFVLTVDWPASGLTLRQVIAEMLPEQSPRGPRTTSALIDLVMQVAEQNKQ